MSTGRNSLSNLLHFRWKTTSAKSARHLSPASHINSWPSLATILQQPLVSGCPWDLRLSKSGDRSTVVPCLAQSCFACCLSQPHWGWLSHIQPPCNDSFRTALPVNAGTSCRPCQWHLLLFNCRISASQACLFLSRKRGSSPCNTTARASPSHRSHHSQFTLPYS
jgi:hypothetical protein